MDIATKKKTIAEYIAKSVEYTNKCKNLDSHQMYVQQVGSLYVGHDEDGNLLNMLVGLTNATFYSLDSLEQMGKHGCGPQQCSNGAGTQSKLITVKEAIADVVKNNEEYIETLKTF